MPQSIYIIIWFPHARIAYFSVHSISMISLFVWRRRRRRRCESLSICAFVCCHTARIETMLIFDECLFSHLIYLIFSRFVCDDFMSGLHCFFFVFGLPPALIGHFPFGHLQQTFVALFTFWFWSQTHTAHREIDGALLIDNPYCIFLFVCWWG